jgi:hypothetical protein
MTPPEMKQRVYRGPPIAVVPARRRHPDYRLEAGKRREISEKKMHKRGKLNR